MDGRMDWEPEMCRNCEHKECPLYMEPVDRIKQDLKIEKWKQRLEYLKNEEKYYWGQYQEAVLQSIRRTPAMMMNIIEICNLNFKQYQQFSEKYMKELEKGW